MSNRYFFLEQDDIFDALNSLRAALLAAKDGKDVDEIMFGLFTDDERLKIGRRIVTAQLINAGLPFREIQDQLKVGQATINIVAKKLIQYPRCFSLIGSREEKVEAEYQKRAYKKVGGSLQVHKKTEHTGFSRKQVKR